MLAPFTVNLALLKDKCSYAVGVHLLVAQAGLDELGGTVHELQISTMRVLLVAPRQVVLHLPHHRSEHAFGKSSDLVLVTVEEDWLLSVADATDLLIKILLTFINLLQVLLQVLLYILPYVLL